MLPTFLRKYESHYVQIYVIMIGILFAYYIFRIIGGAGGDLELRLSEAKYFLNGINPYDVYIGKVDPIASYGRPNSYSFFSYYFASVLTCIDSVFWQKVVYGVLDIILLVAGIALTTRIVGKERSLSGPFIIAILLSSVFFWQHVTTLNYNLVAAFGIILTFYGISRSATFLMLIGIIIVGVKPSLAIPTLLYLFISKRWRLFIYAVLAYGVALIGACIWIDTNPIDLVVQLKDTQTRFSNGHTDGFFFFLKPFLHEHIKIVEISISVFALVLFRKHILDPLSGLIIVITLGISLFYNQVHAWVIVYPLLVYVIIGVLDKDFHPALLILPLAFIITPRLAGLLSEEARDGYVMIHNIVRFGLLFVTCFYLISKRNAKRSRNLGTLNSMEKLA